MTMTRLDKLAQIRKTAGVTQDQVAAALGVSKATYSSWETGRAELGAKRIVALAEFFECTPNDILGFGSNEMRYAIISQEEQEMVELLRLLPPNIKDDLLDIMRSTVKGWRL